jgi:hypothetical protein
MNKIMNRYSLFLDVSGIIARETANQSYYTVGGVLIATVDVQKARAVVNSIGKKWRDMDNSSAIRMTEAILAHSMSISARQIRKSQPYWGRFWDEGDQFHSFMASTEKSPVGFVKSSNLIRYAAFGGGRAQSVGHCLKRHGLPRIVAPTGYSPLELTVVCDTDIQGQENIDVFRNMWSEYQRHSKVKEVFKVEHQIQAVDFKTEQDEPLLLAPDFVAGCFQWYLGKPEVPVPKNMDESCAESIIKEFQRSDNFILDQREFRLTYKEIFGDLMVQSTS